MSEIRDSCKDQTEDNFCVRARESGLNRIEGIIWENSDCAKTVVRKTRFFMR